LPAQSCVFFFFSQLTTIQIYTQHLKLPQRRIRQSRRSEEVRYPYYEFAVLPSPPHQIIVKQNTKIQIGRDLDAQDIQELLDYDLGRVEQDIIRAIKDGQAFVSSEQERTKHFTDNPRLKKWLTGRHSEVLLVNGSYVAEKISPLTFACGIFARSVASFPGAIPLTFFCGMHIDRSREDVGAALMLSSLVSQLLAGYLHYNFDFLDTWDFNPKDIGANSPDRVEALLSLFFELLEQLPENQIVFCLIDGIQYYEYQGRAQDTCHVVSNLLDQITNTETKAVFKLLITTPESSASVARIVPKENVWTMPQNIERSAMGFNMRHQQRVHEIDFQQASKIPDADSSTDGGWSNSEDDIDSKDELEYQSTQIPNKHIDENNSYIKDRKGGKSTSRADEETSSSSEGD